MTEVDPADAQPSKRPTLAQVAEASKVSLKTASRALAGEPHVREGTRQRVLEQARMLGYQRNSAASLLASGRSLDHVGVITGDLTNPFYAALAQGIEDGVRGRGLWVTLASSAESVETEWKLARSFVSQRCLAVIVVSAMEEHSAYAAIQASGTPVVFVDRRARGIDADSVVLDNVEGGRLATDHLLRSGHRRIVYVGDFDWLPTQRDRVRGFGAAMENVGVTDWRRCVHGGVHDAEAARALTAGLLEGSEPPTAFVAGNNRVALGVLREIKSRDDASAPALIGFDDVEWADIGGMSVVAHNPVEMGRRAASLVVQRMADRDRPVESVVLPVRLIPRGSGERAFVG